PAREKRRRVERPENGDGEAALAPRRLRPGPVVGGLERPRAPVEGGVGLTGEETEEHDEGEGQEALGGEAVEVASAPRHRGGGRERRCHEEPHPGGLVEDGGKATGAERGGWE